MRTTPVRDRRAPESRELRYVFNGHPVRTGPELVEAMRRDWQAAGDLLAGRVDPGLEEWLRSRPGGDDVVRELRLETSGGARLIRLQAALDPGGPLMFQGREVTDASLDRAIRAANSWTPDAAGETDQCHRWLTGIRREQILKAMAAVVEGDTAERLGAADQRLRTWSRQTRDVLDRIPEKEERTVAEGAESACLGLLFSVALGATGPEDSHRRVMAAVSTRDTAGAPWAEDLAARVLRSAPGDLGLVIPAAAVISAVTADNRARRARQEAEEASRRRREEEERRRREAAARASAAQDRRNRRRRALIGQLCLRIPTSLAYSAFAGTSLTAAVSHPHEPNWGLWWPNTLPVLEACSVTVALACLLDWFLDSPRGGCRYPVGGIGLGIGVWGCLRFTAYAPDFFAYGMLWVMPWSFGVAMMVATVLDWLISRADSLRYPENRASQTITKRAGARLLLTGLGAASGIGVLLLSPLSPSEPFLRSAEAASARVTPLHVDILGIGGAPGMVVALAIVCNILHLTAAPLARVRPPLGIAAAVIGPLLGLLVFLAYPLNLVKIIIGWVIGMAS